MIYCFSIGDTDMYVTYDYEITYRGFRGNRDEPPEGMEYKTTVTGLYEDIPVKTSNPIPLDCPDWLAKMIEEEMNYSDRVYRDIENDIG